MPTRIGAIAVAGILVLVGCAESGTPTTWNEIIKQNYDPNTLSGGSLGPGIRVSVVGETFGRNRTDLSDKLAELLSRSHFGPKVEFASRINNDDDWRVFEVRFLFSPAPGADFNTLCTDESFKQETPKPGVVEFLASYCRKGRRLNSIRGRVRGGIDSPAFDQLVSQATYSLFPPPGYPFDGRLSQDYK